MLRAPEPAWGEVERALVEPIRWLSQLTPTDHAQMDPFLLVNALEAVSATYVALETEDRREARLAVERLRQTLHDMAETAPVGATADRVRTLAQAVAHLRHALTPAGCVGWLERPHPDLAGRRPAELLADPVAHRTLVDLAAGTRISTAA